MMCGFYKALIVCLKPMVATNNNDLHLSAPIVPKLFKSCQGMLSQHAF